MTFRSPARRTTPTNSASRLLTVAANAVGISADQRRAACVAVDSPPESRKLGTLRRGGRNVSGFLNALAPAGSTGTPAMGKSGIEAFVEMLRAAGVEYLFGNPGTTELPLNDALVSRPEM